MVRRIVFPLLSGAAALALGATLPSLLGGGGILQGGSLTLVEWLGLAVPGSFALLLAWESAWPANSDAPSVGWSGVGLLGFVMLTLVGTLAPLLIPAPWLSRLALVDAGSLGHVASFLIGWALYTLLGYAWHRLCHRSPLLWRFFHQLHHAPRRLDVASSTVFHPSEALVYTGITLAVSCTLGLTPEAAALLGWMASFVSFFQHANVRTPRLLGYFLQRPEAHGLHHLAGGPSGNYSDLPLWDVVFGTFQNPREFSGEVGFSAPAARRVFAMLRFVDVTSAGVDGPAVASLGVTARAPITGA